MKKVVHHIINSFVFIVVVIFYMAVKIETVDRYMSTEELKRIGYRDINITGFSWFGCNIKYTKRAKFIAVNFDGKEVSGSVCGDIYQTRMINLDGNERT